MYWWLTPFYLDTHWTYVDSWSSKCIDLVIFKWKKHESLNNFPPLEKKWCLVNCYIVQLYVTLLNQELGQVVIVNFFSGRLPDGALSTAVPPFTPSSGPTEKIATFLFEWAKENYSLGERLDTKEVHFVIGKNLIQIEIALFKSTNLKEVLAYVVYLLAAPILFRSPLAP